MEAESAEEEITDHIRDVEGMGQLVGKDLQGINFASVSAGDAARSKKGAGYTENTDKAVLIVEKLTEQSEIGRAKKLREERKAEKNPGDGEGAYALVERADNVDEMWGQRC